MVRSSCLQFIRCMCSHITLLGQHLAVTYLVDLYSALIGQLRQRHGDEVMRGSCGTNEIAGSDDMVLTLAALISVFDIDTFNSCLLALVTDMVRHFSLAVACCNFYICTNKQHSCYVV